MFCKNCGNQLNKDSKFCGKCGANVDVISTNDTTIVGNLPASALARLANYLLDRILGGIVFCFVFISIWGLVNIISNTFLLQENIFIKILNAIIPVLIALAFYVNLPYYLFFEGIWGRTLGKWITKTKVVRFDGRKPHFLQILGRTFARLIPFEAFSFLFSNNPIGWHDRLSKTIIVPSNYTIEDVKKINFDEAKKQKGSPLLVVIAIVGGLLIFVSIIGILASVVLASLNTARVKGTDASIKADLANARAQAEIYYNNNSNSYFAVCTSSNGIVPMKNNASEASGSEVICNDSATAWAMSSPLKSNTEDSWCVDSLGNNKEISGGITKYYQFSCSAGDTTTEDSTNEENSSSPKETGIEYCNRVSGEHATYDLASNSCGCEKGYIANSGKCMTPNASCNKSYLNSYSTGIDKTTGKNNCDCKAGYVINSKQTACISANLGCFESYGKWFNATTGSFCGTSAPGCVSSVGYSSTTGLACDGSQD